MSHGSGFWGRSRVRLLLCVAVFAVSGCVEAPRYASDEELGDLKQELEARPKPPPVTLAAPGRRRSMSDQIHIHVDAVTECSGLLGRQQVVYAEAWTTSPGVSGQPFLTRRIDIEFRVVDGLFEGLLLKGPERQAEAISASMVLTGSRLSDPCGCVRVMGNAKVPLGTEIQASTTVCPE